MEKKLTSFPTEDSFNRHERVRLKDRLIKEEEEENPKSDLDWKMGITYICVCVCVCSVGVECVALEIKLNMRMRGETKWLQIRKEQGQGIHSNRGERVIDARFLPSQWF